MTELSLAPPNRPLAAAGMVLIAGTLIGFTDNFVQLLAEDAGLWQFHFVRSLMALPFLALIGRLSGQRLLPRRWVAVAARSLLMSASMMVYFGCLAFLPVATVSAALFTAPIFVLIIVRLVYGEAFGPWRVLAVALGFLGIVLMLHPSAGTIRPVAVVPVAAAALYAMSNVATRAWCGGESATALTIGFFAAMLFWGALGIGVLALWPQAVPAGADGFVLRGWVTPSALFWQVTAMQAVGSLLGVLCLARAYQLAAASQVAIFEYQLLIASAIWGALLWNQRFAPGELAGMAAIVGAGVIVAWRARFTARHAAARLPA